MGECFQWKATGQCSKGNSAVQSWSSIWKQMRGSKPEKTAFLSRTWYVGKDWQWKKVSGKREASSSDVRSRILCRYRYCKNPSCNCWHRPVCQNYKSETGCVFWQKMLFSTRWGGGESQQGVEEWWCKWNSCSIQGNHSIRMRVSRSSSRKIYSMGRRNVEIKSRRKIIQEQFGTKENSGKKGSLARSYPWLWASWA